MAKARSWAYILLLIAIVYLVASNGDLRHSIVSFSVAWVKPILIPVIDMILDPAFIYTTSFLIFVAAVFSCLLFFFKVVRPELDRMKVLRSEIVRLLRFRTQDTPPSQSAIGLHTLGDFLQKLGLYTFAWASFQKEMAEKRSIPAYSFHYFAANDPLGETVDDDELMAALPGYFVSVGLILTFSGLVVALYFAAKGFRAGNVEQSQEAILQLLNASAFKFLTSIAALASALLITIFHGFCDSLIRTERTRALVSIDHCITQFREAETASIDRGVTSRDPDARIEMLIEAISKLNAEVDRLSATISAAGLLHAIEK